eukprot:366138-Chlamydomonas_euryale.AAC.1
MRAHAPGRPLALCRVVQTEVCAAGGRRAAGTYARIKEGRAVLRVPGEADWALAPGRVAGALAHGKVFGCHGMVWDWWLGNNAVCGRGLGMGRAWQGLGMGRA